MCTRITLLCLKYCVNELNFEDEEFSGRVAKNLNKTKN